MKTNNEAEKKTNAITKANVINVMVFFLALNFDFV